MNNIVKSTYNRGVKLPQSALGGCAPGITGLLVGQVRGPMKSVKKLHTATTVQTCRVSHPAKPDSEHDLLMG